jgi:hypothetical protein
MLPIKKFGRCLINRFIETFVRPYAIAQDLEDAYRQMAQDEVREVEALKWAEYFIGDIDK